MNVRIKLSIRSVLAFLLCTGLLACSKSSPPIPTSSSQNALEPVSLQLQWVTQAQFAGYYVALDKGWYREEGIDLTIKSGGPDMNPADSVATGMSDFGTALLADLSLAVQNGLPVKSIAQIQQASGLVLLTKKSSGITTPIDFVGKRVGLWFGVWEAQFNALMASRGIPTQEVQLVSQGWGMDPFLKGNLDVASAMIYNEYHTVLEEGIKPDELNMINYADYDLDFPGDTLFTTHHMIRDKYDLCRRMIRATLRGWQYAIEHPEEAVDIVLEHDKSGVQTRTHQLRMMHDISKLVQIPDHPLGKANRTDVDRMINTLLRFDVLNKTIAPEDVCIQEFLDPAQQNT